MPWTMKVVFSSIRIDTRHSSANCPTANCQLASNLLHSPARRLVHRDRPVAVLDAVLLEDPEALVLPGAGDPEDRDLLGRVVAEFDAGLDDSARDDVHTGVRDDRHHHRDLVDAR